MVLVQAFLDGAARPPGDGDAGRAAALATLVEEGRAAWPGVALAPALFARHLGRHWGAEPTAAWPKDRAANLWIAAACASDVAGAAAAFEAAYGAIVDRVIDRLRLKRDHATEAKQLVRVRLLVREGDGPARIGGYAGRGDLGAWVRAAATRVALNLVRDEPSGDADEELLARLPAGSDDPELRVLKTRYATEFNAALQGALASLGARERLLLKQHYVDGLSTDELGGLHRVHRVTVLRWLVAARDAVAREAERRLGAAIGATPAEIASVVRLVRSQINLSLGACLRAD